jgi:hypothetical protein
MSRNPFNALQKRPRWLHATKNLRNCKLPSLHDGRPTITVWNDAAIPRAMLGHGKGEWREGGYMKDKGMDLPFGTASGAL